VSLALERDVFDEIRDSKRIQLHTLARAPGMGLQQLNASPWVLCRRGYAWAEYQAIIYPRLLRRYARGVMLTSRWNVRVKCALSEKPTACAI